MHELTTRQQEILDLIENYIKEHDAPPTRVEIARIMGFSSPNAAEDHLKALAKKGKLELVPGTSRGIRLAKSPGIPKIVISQAHLSEDSPLQSNNYTQDYLQLDKHLFQPSVSFFLQAPHLEIKNIELKHTFRPNDLIAIHATHLAKENQIILQRVDNKLVLERFPSLHPSGKIEGVVVGVIKTQL